MARVSARPDTIPVRLVALCAATFDRSFGPRAAEGTPWRLTFRERGRAELALPGRVIALPPGRAVLIAPDIGVDAKPDGDALHLLLEFELGRGRDAAALPLSDVPIVLDADATRDELARSLLRELAAGAAPGSALCARAQALLHLCLSSVLDLAGEADAALRGPASDARTQLLPVLRYIDAHLAGLLPNSKLAEVAHASESHFIRMFRRTFGRTPARHVQERRVSTAAELLLRTSLSIDEIAERSGFANRYHFSRVFAQRMSHPPARFRALHGSAAARAGDPSAFGNF
ncbi:MAG TPA: AraC family transcriptional regulator [Myxococcota bacterium]|nr:AraC family transcriptional regulator [Myxococcota bacterium]